MKYSLITFGCRVNQADTLAAEDALRASGAAPADSPQRADLVIVNTCSVTASADQSARQTIRRIARDNPSARIIVTGCYATRRPDDVAALPNVDAVVANDDKPRLLQIARRMHVASGGEAWSGQASDEMTTAERFGGGDGACGAAIAPGSGDRTAFTLRVQTGCAEGCTYCIIPATRGRPRSLPLDAVLREAERAAGAGYKEIALTGVHLGSYGRDLSPASSIVDLLQALAARRCGVRFRISSLEPMDCTPELVDLVAREPCFAPHFHLPLQHASDRMLAAMGRPYTLERYAVLVDRIRERLPDASIGSDLIVGFPGEDERDVDLLADYLSRSPLTHVHVFPYSDRPGTAASAMGGRVPGAIVRARGARVRAIGRELAHRFRQSQIGTVQRGLTLEDGSLVVTGNYLKLRIAPGLSRNEWVSVRVRGEGELGEILEFGNWAIG